MRAPRIIPRSWRVKLAHHYLVEILTVILAIGSGVFGVSIVTMTDAYRRVPSFAEAFRWAPPHAWGLVMVVLAAFAVALLIHSRAAAAIPTLLLGIVWAVWVIPIGVSPNFAPSAPIVYTILAMVTLVVGTACLVPRGETGHG